MKTCSRCKEAKPLEEFHRRTSAHDGRQSFCKGCNNKNVREWMAENPDRFEANWRRHTYGDEAVLKRRARKYGITPQRLKAMIDAADGKCTICERTPANGLVVDHCHNSNAVRGLICHNCNTALGLMNDDIAFLQNAIDYLKNTPVYLSLAEEQSFKLS